MEYKTKPGFIVRGDWELELNRTETLTRDGDDDPSCAVGTQKKTRSSGKHRVPCGRFGCVRCALAPSGAETDPDMEEASEDTDFDTIPSPNDFAGNLPPYAPYRPLPYPPGYFAPPVPMTTFPPGITPGTAMLPPPVPVINPQTGQRYILQPAFPGQPGVLMLHAMSGQPILVNPNPPTLPIPAHGIASQHPATIAQGPGRLPASAPVASAQTIPNAPQTPQQTPPFVQGGIGAASGPGLVSGHQPGQWGTTSPAWGAFPGAAIAPSAQSGFVWIDARTGQPVPVPRYGFAQHSAMQQPGMIPPGTTGIAGMMPPGSVGAPQGMANGVTPDTPAGDMAADMRRKEEQRSAMPHPKYHALPVRPVFQRSEGLAKTSEQEKEEQQRRKELERTLGIEVPENANIAPNGINQQILQTSAAGAQGGGPANGSPFSSISGALGLHGKSNSKISSSREKNPREDSHEDSDSERSELWIDFEAIQESETVPRTESSGDSRIALQSMSVEKNTNGKSSGRNEQPVKQPAKKRRNSDPTQTPSAAKSKAPSEGLFGRFSMKSLLGASEDVVLQSQILEEQARKQAIDERKKKSRESVSSDKREFATTVSTTTPETDAETKNPSERSGKKKTPLNTFATALGLADSSGEREIVQHAKTSSVAMSGVPAARRVSRVNKRDPAKHPEIDPEAVDGTGSSGEDESEYEIEDESGNEHNDGDRKKEETETNRSETEPSESGELPYGISFEDEPDVLYIEIEDENDRLDAAPRRYVSPKYSGPKLSDEAKEKIVGKAVATKIRPSNVSPEEILSSEPASGKLVSRKRDSIRRTPVQRGKSVFHGIASLLNRPVAPVASHAGTVRGGDLMIGNPLLRHNADAVRHETRHFSDASLDETEFIVYEDDYGNVHENVYANAIVREGTGGVIVDVPSEHVAVPRKIVTTDDDREFAPRRSAEPETSTPLRRTIVSDASAIATRRHREQPLSVLSFETPGSDEGMIQAVPDETPLPIKPPRKTRNDAQRSSAAITPLPAKNR